jgi:hypothetical protein
MFLLKITILKIWIMANVFFNPLYHAWTHNKQIDDVNIEI